MLGYLSLSVGTGFLALPGSHYHLHLRFCPVAICHPYLHICETGIHGGTGEAWDTYAQSNANVLWEYLNNPLPTSHMVFLRAGHVAFFFRSP